MFLIEPLKIYDQKYVDIPVYILKCAVFHGLCPLVLIKGNGNAAAFNYILDNSVTQTLWQGFVEP